MNVVPWGSCINTFIQVHKEFGHLFQMKVVIFIQELLSVVLTPFILWYSLPPCAPAIVDFFREFSVHVDGLDYVCSFAVFDFKRHGNIKVFTSCYFSWPWVTNIVMIYDIVWCSDGR